MYPLALVTGQIGENSYSIKQKKQKKQIKLIDFFHPNVVSVTPNANESLQRLPKTTRTQKTTIPTQR